MIPGQLVASGEIFHGPVLFHQTVGLSECCQMVLPLLRAAGEGAVKISSVLAG
jgi:hypothetical protein